MKSIVSFSDKIWSGENKGWKFALFEKTNLYAKTYQLLFNLDFGSIFFFSNLHAITPNSGNPDSLAKLRQHAIFKLENRSVAIGDVKLVQSDDWKQLYRIPRHPGFDLLLTPEKEAEILSEINRRRRELPTDTLLTADYFYVWKPYFEWLRHEDPHYRIFPITGVSGDTYKSIKHMQKDKRYRKLPLEVLCINDTIVVDRSFDPLFKKGDMIVSVNGVEPFRYLKYSYDDRYSSMYLLMLYHYYDSAVDHFDVKLIREGKPMEVATGGFTQKEMRNAQIPDRYDITTYEDAGCGYIQIAQFFPNNSRLIKIVRNAIIDFKAKGFSNVVIDIRRNGGGNGHNFDKLISIFTDKPTIPYLKGQKLKVSDKTLKYFDFITEDMMGQLVDIPEGDFVKEFDTDPKMYIDGMNYYVLISRNTGSIAASFANILQFNDAAKLVGEPLMHNALKYGEASFGGALLPTLLGELSISTIEMDEHTKAVDGILVPDIPIPYVAADFMDGKDGMLEKLLDIFRIGTI